MKSEEKRVSSPPFWKREDWFAVWIGIFFIAVAVSASSVRFYRIPVWDNLQKIQWNALVYSTALVYVLLFVPTTLAVRLSNIGGIRKYFAFFSLLLVLSFLSVLISANELVSRWGLEFVIWALLLGLFSSNVLNLAHPFKDFLNSELFIKSGLVLLGAELSLSTVLRAGIFGLIQATLGVFLVWYFCYFLATKLGMSKSFSAIMATGVSICGVSAAIAAGGAVKGKPEEVAYVTSIILLAAAPMVVLIPLVARAIQLSGVVAGAWIGGLIDTTPAVVAAGALYGEEAMQIATLVKMSQNAMIGVAAFLLALYWTLRVEAKAEERPKPLEVWYRFPKFILGFTIAFLMFSFLLPPVLGDAGIRSVLGVTGELRKWLFAMAFISIGLRTKFAEFVKFGKGKPALAFLGAQLFNAFVTLLLAATLFGAFLRI
jgi:uncharacterized membrane protein YadS